MTALNQIIETFVKVNVAPYPQSRVPVGHVHLESYWPSAASGSNEYHLAAMLQIPDINHSKIRVIARDQMRTTARNLRYLGARPTKEALGRIDASVNLQESVALSSGGDADLHTMGEDFVPGDRNIKLHGNNIEGPFGPYVLLHGLVAVALAGQLVTA